VIIGWLRVYEQERIDCAIADSENEAKQAKADMDAGSYYTDYIEGLKSRALCGDEEAERALAVHMNTDSLIKQLEDERKGKYDLRIH
jgi:hypothetical protein